MANDPSLCVLIPYFGHWPTWMPFFLASCRANPSVDWLMFSDCGQPDDCPPNVRVVATEFAEYCALIGKRLEIDFHPESPYKLCDLKPALGYVHEDRLTAYDFWAFGDLDVVYGRLREYFTAERLARFDLISTHARRVSGHLTLVRNTARMREAFKLIPDWQERFCGPHAALDEGAFSRIFLWHKNFPRPLFEFVGLFNPWRRRSDFREAFSTPFGRVPWTGGDYVFPNEWYWNNGRLTNDSDGEREFPYLHFMFWKSREWMILGDEILADYPRLARTASWRISASGFKIWGDRSRR